MSDNTLIAYIVLAGFGLLAWLASAASKFSSSDESSKLIKQDIGWNVKTITHVPKFCDSKKKRKARLIKKISKTKV